VVSLFYCNHHSAAPRNRTAALTKQLSVCICSCNLKRVRRAELVGVFCR
ncbi:unnamed protein product, partial [Larinioides sclopetarius]